MQAVLFGAGYALPCFCPFLRPSMGESGAGQK